MKTLESYDQIPYESFAITETHPDVLASIGWLFGLETADPEHCRVLELGAASGGNLIPMAFHLPWSQFVGVELSGAQARAGQAMIAELGLGNLRLLHQDIMAVDAHQEPFDFILVHGVYSWVPDAVKERILELCGRLLSARGIAYISYNVLPGWRQRGMLRDMLLFHCRGITAPGARLRRARDLLDRLALGLREDRRPEAQPLRKEVTYLLSARPSYLYHEYLEETNHPELFSDVIARAQQQGLAFLAESKLHTMFSSTLGGAARQVLDGLGDQMAQEQYMDFLRLRAFRQTLLVRAEARPCWEIDLERLGGCSLHGDLQPLQAPQWKRVKPQDYRAQDGAMLQVEQPLTKAILAELAEVYPNAIPVRRLLEAAEQRVRAGAGRRVTPDRDACLGELFNLYVSQGIGLTQRRTWWSNRVGVRPQAIAVARAQAASGEGHVATVRHRSLGLDALSAWVLRELDGRRDQAALCADLIAQAHQDDALSAALGGASRLQDEDLRQRVRTSLTRLLEVFARAGLLVPEEGDGGLGADTAPANRVPG
ncbi:methyltransferase regulatory domain-containing protein [Thiocapsa imhoffii]|uniref:methyltransferase regulatory domain-containing protein n=1 Tax=Thiocapsa imhoffii TaxID=382777 RepID=UPI001F5BEC56|nr:class I SAM-dependent methyltransferase [Thiocapsa imhoffii]